MSFVPLVFRPFKALFDKRFFVTLPKDVCQKRRSERIYFPPDPPGYFEECVWPMYIHNRKHFESFHTSHEIIYMDGTQSDHDIFSIVRQHIQQLF